MFFVVVVVVVVYSYLFVCMLNPFWGALTSGERLGS